PRLEDAAYAPADWPRVKGEVAVTEELGSEVNVIFHMAAPQVHHDIMIARFDKAAKDEVEAEELAGEGQSLGTARGSTTTPAQTRRRRSRARPRSGRGRARACGRPGSTPRPRLMSAAASTWPSTAAGSTSSTSTAARP